MTYALYDDALAIRDTGGSAITATQTEPGIAHPVRYVGGPFKAMVHVEALDTSDGNETYTVEIIVADTTANLAGSGTTVATVDVTETGVYEVPLSAAVIAKLDPDAAAITTKATLGGTSPSMTYGAYLTATR